jgi:hypothetical protein
MLALQAERISVLEVASERFLACSESLAQRLRQLLALRDNIEEKNMFGGVGFLLNGNMLVGVWIQRAVSFVEALPAK